MICQRMIRAMILESLAKINILRHYYIAYLLENLLSKNSYKVIAILCINTCKCRVSVVTGTHCKTRVLQQPEQRCTSTHGGHNKKLAFRLSNIERVTSITSVLTLHIACWAT